MIYSHLSSTSCTITTGCKVNLNLYITGILPNGWHKIDSIFLPLSEPHDELHIEITNHNQGLHLSCNILDIELENNILTKTYTLFTKATHFTPSISIYLKKGIPYGAGLGGGSSDAAALLTWLQKNSPLPLSPSKLLKLAAKIGADVPFFLKNKPCRATGIGEKLEEISLSNLNISGNTLFIICPNLKISTPYAYKMWDDYNKKQIATSSRYNNNLTKKYSWDRSSPSTHLSDYLWMKNDFEPVIFSEYTELSVFKEQLLQFGARAAVLSGSGSSIYGLFKEYNQTSIMTEFYKKKNILTFSQLLQ
ncbi:4-(cytidine 5'-diphospho)-2-C-methyl-D-erythritol kinase [Lawsonia intracellularis]|uniref:4-(cytidine 5'-diphospho)-2-C-methyl-D-erythritol kinase n=1 Tax=Lawsonia intracellularis TaxID=29546 RepID=UPI000975D944|nr:4-(cytidine 5'-diphospho)-2-C-methyl-D-erythritol kinase [Lawsonia intracellularis]OMQ03217.1 4-(cytidine 5'-diphospho)-2-C-methyl-D-erythritol kinase [Lawsonia intracellularis]